MDFNQATQPPSFEQQQADTTAIPVQAVDADQLPREKGWTYEEMSSIVGSLYLDSHHQIKVREEQFSAVISEYEKRILQIQAQLQVKQEEVDGLLKSEAALKRELETRNGNQKQSGDRTSSGNDGDNQMRNNG